MNDLRTFNENLRKDVTYDNVKSHKKSAFHLLYRRYIFRKATERMGWRGGGGWGEIDPASGFTVKLNPINIALLLQEATQQYWERIIEQNVVITMFTATWASFAFLSSRVFSVSWTQYSAKIRQILSVTSDHHCRKQFRFLVWKCFFPNYTTCIKIRVYNYFNLPYFMSSIIERLYKPIFYKSF